MKQNLLSLLALILILSDLKAQNIGINMPTPQQSLHIGGVSGTLRADGLANGGNFNTIPNLPGDNLIFANPNGDLNKMPNGTSGQVLKINNSGSLTWAKAPVKYNVKGTTPVTISNQASLLLMPQMTLTFIPNNTSVTVLFFAMGGASTIERPIQFTLRVNGVSILFWRASSEDSMGNEWATSMNYPVTVTPGVSTTIEVFWGQLSSFFSYQITNGVTTPVARSLTVLDM